MIQALYNAIDRNNPQMILDVIADKDFDPNEYLFIQQEDLIKWCVSNKNSEVVLALLRKKPVLSEYGIKKIKELCENDWSDNAEALLKLVDDCPRLEKEASPIMLDGISPETNLDTRDELLCKRIESVLSNKQEYNIFNYFSADEISALSGIKTQVSNEISTLSGIKTQVSKYDEPNILSQDDHKTLEDITLKLQASLDNCLKSWDFVSRSTLVIISKDAGFDDNWHRDYGGRFRITAALNDKGTMFLGDPSENITSYSNYNFDIFQAAQGALSIFKIGDGSSGAIHKRPPFEVAERMLLIMSFYRTEDPTQIPNNLSISYHGLEVVGQEFDLSGEEI